MPDAAVTLADTLDAKVLLSVLARVRSALASLTLAPTP